MKRNIFVVFILVLLSCSCNVTSQNIDGSTLRESIRSFLDAGVGVVKMQEHLDSQQFETQTEGDGTQIVDQLAKGLSTKITSRSQIVRNLVNDANYNTYGTTPVFENCCFLDDEDFVYDPRFSAKVNLNSMCYYGKADPDAKLKHAGEPLLKTFKSNLDEEPNIKWQYFATEQGLLFNYPAATPLNCTEFDPRGRLWYTLTASPEAKDVVIVLDNSAAMAEDSLQTLTLQKAAARAAMKIIRALSPRDKVGVVTFSDTVLTVPLCFGDTFSSAGPYVKNELQKYLEFVIPSGTFTNYSAGIEQGLNILLQHCTNTSCSIEDRNREKVLVFMSGSQPLDTEFVMTSTFQAFKSRVANLQVKPVRLISYGIGTLDQVITNRLTLMTQQPDITTGVYTALYSEEILEEEVAKFYTHLADNSRTVAAQLTFPYSDAFGLGKVLTFAAPVIYQGDTVGVVGIDLSLTDLLSDFLSLHKGRKSYAFVVDRKYNNVLTHPLLPEPFELPYADEDEPFYVPLSLVEQNRAVAPLLSEVLSGVASGQQVLPTETYHSLGNSFREGVYITNQSATYYFQAVDGIALTVIFVDFSDDVRTLTTNSKEQARFTYHLTDLEDKVQTHCKMFFHKTYNETSVVKFAPQSFTKPDVYLFTDETNTTVHEYHDILNGKITETTQGNSFSAGVVEDVRMTGLLDIEWTDGAAKLSLVPQSVWRFIGTQHGVFRLYPSAAIKKLFDPTLRPWYQRAAANPQSISVSTPYRDYFGAGYINTISQALIDPVTDGAYAVMGADVKPTYLFQTIVSLYPPCAQEGFSCFLMDAAGYIVMHPSWIELDITTEPLLEHVHITRWEPGIAEHMFTMGYLNRSTCNNILYLREQLFTETILPSDSADHLETINAWYKIDRVPDSNLYIVLKSNRESGTAQRTQCTCDITKDQIKIPMCILDTVFACECPCYKDATLEFCPEQVKKEPWIPCPPAQVDPFSQDPSLPSALNVLGLNYCLDPQCELRASQSDCHQFAQCQWCQYEWKGPDNNVTALDKPYCALWQDCMRGQKGHPSIYNEDYGFEYRDLLDPGQSTGKESGLSGGTLIAICILVPLGILLIIVEIWAAYKYLSKKNTGDPQNLVELLEDLTHEDPDHMRSASISMGPGGVPYLVIDKVDAKLLDPSKGMDMPRGSIVLPHGSLVADEGEQDEEEDHWIHAKHKKKGAKPQALATVMIPLSNVDTSEINADDSESLGSEGGPPPLIVPPPPVGRRKSSTVDDLIIGGR